MTSAGGGPLDLAGEIAADLRGALAQHATRVKLAKDLSLEALVTSAELAGFQPSAPQLALIRAADGTPLDGVLTDAQMLFHFGALRLPSGRPSILIPRTGVRAGKSLLAAMGLLQSILTARFRRPAEDGEQGDAAGTVGVRPGELVRALIVTPALATSASSFHHLVGTMQASPALKQLLVKDPGAEMAVIRRPDGHQVTVQVAAARASGLNLRSTWLAGVLFDEADFHRDESGAVNLPDNFRAARPRMLPGAQIWLPSSPWADSGPYHEMFTQAFGRPSRTIAFHSDSRSMNPTLDRETEAEERRRDPDNAAREFDGIPLASGSAAFFDRAALDAAVDLERPLALEPRVGVIVAVGCDFGFRADSSSIAVVHRRDGIFHLAELLELQPQKGAPLQPSAVVAAFATIAKRHGCRTLVADGHYAEAIREHLSKHGLALLSAPEGQGGKAETYVIARSLLHEGRVRLPEHPRLLRQMRDVVSKPTPGGGLSITSPRRVGGGHGDLVSALVLALWSAARFGGTEAPAKVVGRREFGGDLGLEGFDVDARGIVRPGGTLRSRGTGGF